MQKTAKKTVVKPVIKTGTKAKDDQTDPPKKSQDEKLKRTFSNLSTPRNFVPKSTTADIYSKQKKTTLPMAKAPIRSQSTLNNPSPMRGLLKSSSSSVSVASSKSTTEKKPKLQTVKKKDVKISAPKKPPATNVTVNSPKVKKKLEKEFAEKSPEKPREGRQRQSTRTLSDDEVKVLTAEAVDNNKEMMKLNQKLTAQPKAFFVDLGSGDHDRDTLPVAPKPQTPSSSEVSYEDDFESYESDFDSYHSSNEGNSERESSGSGEGAGKDEDMLDSGNFELREAQRSAKYKANLDFIEEVVELDKKPSLTDEGFQEMSTSSTGPSSKTSHVDFLDRPLFIDFKKSKETKRKRLINERQQQRAKDILGMVSLHEMSYRLFDMQPISYDVYMATFGRKNYTQTAIQTFDDGITEEVQTEEVFCCTKWTQFPIDFSKNDVHLASERAKLERPKSGEEFLRKFTFLLNHKEIDVKEVKNVNNEYKNNALRIYFEQKDGVGTDSMLPYESYQEKIKETKYSIDKLRKFLKKIEGKVSNILTMNTGNITMELTQCNNLPFSKGYVSLDYKNIPEFKFLKYRKLTRIVFSDTKPHFLMTVHKKSSNVTSMEQCLVCLWDISVVSRIPLKFLVAVEDVVLCRFRGSTDGIFVAALDDGSIHLWDLSEQATILKNVTSEKKTADFVEFNTEGLTQIEIDREWNLRNTSVDYDIEELPESLQACAYTSSALNMEAKDTIDTVVGLELLSNDHLGYSQDGGRKIIGQVCSLQRIGVLTLWLIVQVRSKAIETDPGKAYWSKMKLEKTQSISLQNHIDPPIHNSETEMHNFNLTAAKRRLSNRKQEKNIKVSISRPNTSVKTDRPSSVAKLKRSYSSSVLPDAWDCGVLCTDLKVVTCESVDYYLVAKNCGDVLNCTRVAGSFKVNRFCITTDTSTITALSVARGLPYFLAGTNSGTLHLCSLLESRVLLTLDCRSESKEPDRCQTDFKGRYVGTVPVKSTTYDKTNQSSISQIHWSATNPCVFITTTASGRVSCCDLTQSDMHPRRDAVDAAITAGSLINLALLTDGELQIHKLFNDSKSNDQETIFHKYVALL